MLKQLKEDMIAAMRARQKLRLGTIRMVMAAMQKAQIAKKAELDEQECIVLLTREAKKRREAADLYRKGERLELAQKEEDELKVIQGYLPQAISAAQVRTMVKELIERLKPQSQRDMGKIMGGLSPQVRGRFDGKAASAIVREELAKVLS